MSVDRDRIRDLVRRELRKRIAAVAPDGEPSHAALTTFFEEPPSREGEGTERACVIEPSKPCVNSGYCRKLGY